MAILAGQDLTATLINGAISGPIATLRQTTTQTLTSGVYAAITLDSEDVDTDVGHSNVTNNSRYTIPQTGYYEFNGGIVFAANTSGGRAGRWTLNGTALNGSSNQVPPNAASLVAGLGMRTMILFLVAGDFVQMEGYQSSGGNLNTFATAETQSTMTVRWLRA